MLDDIFVSLDLETTGLNPDSAKIIEVAAVKFQNGQVLDVFHSLVNPYVPLPLHVQRLTGITPRQLKSAPPFATLSSDLLSFIGPVGIVGHNVPFDVGFLQAQGLNLSNPLYDTFELATVLFPQLPDWSLAVLAAELKVSSAPCHRALPDAMAAKEVFCALLEKVDALDLSIISEIVRLTTATQWGLHPLFLKIEKDKRQSVTDRLEAGRQTWEGLPFAFVNRAKANAEPLLPSAPGKALDVKRLNAFLEPGGPLEKAFPGYEHRPQQLQMMQAIAKAFNHSEHLLIEAGTGTGKSVAYLLPAVFFASQNNTPVVLSTNTINLQEQLLHKDIPDLLRAVGASAPDIATVQLKGRSNYLCLRRWNSLRYSPMLSLDEAKFLVRSLVWLNSTTSGDRSGLRLLEKEARLWNQVCSREDSCLGEQCVFYKQEHCFLYYARRQALGAHVVITNHALLLSDAAAGSKILPDFGHLVIDEAHHLEDEATEQFGFRISQHDVDDFFNRLNQKTGMGLERGFLPGLKGRLKGSSLAASRREDIDQLAESLRQRVETTRLKASSSFRALASFLQNNSPDQRDYERRLRMTTNTRMLPDWSEIEASWEPVSLAWEGIEYGLSRLHTALEDLAQANINDYPNLMIELSSLLRASLELRRQINTILTVAEKDYIYWVSLNQQSNLVTLSAAPLHVGGLLEEYLFSKKDCVVLTSATLSTEGNFDYIKGRLGLRQVDELLLGSPFDFKSSTLLLLPQDIPEPDKPGYQSALEQGLLDLCRASRGKMLVLFTSHAALRTTYAAIQEALLKERILLLGQGMDGSAHQLLSTFKANPESVLLGTSSFWEGVDVMGKALSMLVITRLPFSVPSDPVFSARAQDFQDGFNDYALPQAVLKLRQGFGRLIRSKTDRGVVVILDRRLKSKRYGMAFLNSLPDCTTVESPLRELPLQVSRWLEIIQSA